MNNANLHLGSNSSDQSIAGRLRQQAACRPDRLALAAPGRTGLTHGQLWLRLQAAVEELNALSVGRDDRVAIVLPNGPELAMAFLTVAATATAAPLNPAFRQPEFDFYLADLQAKALMIESGTDSAARAAARALGIPVLELSASAQSQAGIFTLTSEHPRPSASPGFAEESNVALVLYTSGTTSRPKRVALTQRNLCASVLNHQKALELTEKDLCLNVMPLFHIHGLVSAMLSSVLTGGGEVCTDGFDAGRFFEWTDQFRPTWFTAAPHFCQALLSYAVAHPAMSRDISMRFLRSAAAPMPARLMEQLVDTFHKPVIESYGMTETAAQITSNPLGPGRQRSGSVGIASGPELAIMAENGRHLGPQQVGEIAVRGSSVMSGYESNPEANRACLAGGWFRTGDQGMTDADGYVFILGRIGEALNRGGEKVSAQEVDSVMLRHPAVAESGSFAVPHPRRGQDLATAVVLRADMPATEAELRSFLSTRLAQHKVPSRVLIVERIQKSPTGKVQRNRLAEQFEAELAVTYAAPRDELEALLVNIWGQVLTVRQIGIHDNFFALGGDSLAAVGVVARLESVLSVAVSLRALFDHPTIAEIARFLAEEAGAAAKA